MSSLHVALFVFVLLKSWVYLCRACVHDGNKKSINCIYSNVERSPKARESNVAVVMYRESCEL